MNGEHLTVLRKGVEAWNRWRAENPEVRPDLSGAHLSKADLSGADLSRADLSRADLFGADLSRADLNEAYLNGADLRETDLSQATWTDGRTCKEGSIGRPVFE